MKMSAFVLTPRGQFIADVEKLLIEGKLAAVTKRVQDYEVQLRVKYLKEFVENDGPKRGNAV